MRIAISTFRIVFIYTLFSVLWILFSDSILEFFIHDSLQMSLI